MSPPSRWVPGLGLLGLSLVLPAGWLVPHLLGWRADTAFLSGMLATDGALLRGSVYLLAWLALWTLAPVAGLAGGLLVVWEALSPSSRTGSTAGGGVRRAE